MYRIRSASEPRKCVGRILALAEPDPGSAPFVLCVMLVTASSDVDAHATGAAPVDAWSHAQPLIEGVHEVARTLAAR
jgi:hypothetical protein